MANKSFLQAYATLAHAAVVAAIPLTAGGALLAYTLGGEQGSLEFVIAALIALVASLLGSAAPATQVHAGPARLAVAILLGLSVRFGATLLLALCIAAVDFAASKTLLLYVGVAQLALLATDCIALSRWTRTVLGGARC